MNFCLSTYYDLEIFLFFVTSSFKIQEISIKSHKKQKLCFTGPDNYDGTVHVRKNIERQRLDQY